MALACRHAHVDPNRAVAHCPPARDEYPNRPTHFVSFAEDKVHVVSASDDKSVRLWDVPTGSCTATLHGHTVGGSCTRNQLYELVLAVILALCHAALPPRLPLIYFSRIHYCAV